MYPQNFDSFQQQLNDLQRSYTQLGKTFPAQQQRPKREIHKEDGIDEAKKWAKENLLPGESEAIFDEGKNLWTLCWARWTTSLFRLACVTSSCPAQTTTMRRLS